MSEATDIEKKSLEAHVELCAERYRLLETKLESMDEKITTLFSVIAELRGMLQATNAKQNDRHCYDNKSPDSDFQQRCFFLNGPGWARKLVWFAQFASPVWGRQDTQGKFA
jgi:hypothetical protein